MSNKSSEQGDLAMKFGNKDICILYSWKSWHGIKVGGWFLHCQS